MSNKNVIAQEEAEAAIRELDKSLNELAPRLSLLINGLDKDATVDSLTPEDIELLQSILDILIKYDQFGELLSEHFFFPKTILINIIDAYHKKDSGKLYLQEMFLSQIKWALRTVKEKIDPK